MSDPTTSAPYAQEAAAADRLLDDKLAILRRELDAGDITPGEAAADRVAILEAHLASIRELRRRYFCE